MQKKSAIGALTNAKQKKTSTLYKSPNAERAKNMLKPIAPSIAQKNAPKNSMASAKKILGGNSLKTRKKVGNAGL